MKKILFFTDTMSPGGAFNQMSDLVLHLGNSFEVVLVCGGAERLDPYVKTLSEKGIRIHRSHIVKPADVRWLLYLRRIIHLERPDLIHVHLNHSGSCRFVFFANFGTGIPLIATEHDPFSLQFFKKIVKFLTLKLTTATITLSQANYRFLQKEYGIPKTKLRLIHNGIKDTQEAPATARIDRDCVVFGGIMELHERKGPDILLRAFAQVHAKFPNTKLFIAGTGEMRRELNELVKELGIGRDVQLFGWIRDINRFLDDIDIFVLPSRREAFGLVILEAFARKKPVVATETGGIPDIIVNNVSGILVPPDDIGALAQEMEVLLKDKKTCLMLAEEGYKQLILHFLISHMVHKTTRMYNEYIKANI
jgi:glycosyltransferase involved in cell wall biosynthesis